MELEASSVVPSQDELPPSCEQANPQPSPILGPAEEHLRQPRSEGRLVSCLARLVILMCWRVRHRIVTVRAAMPMMLWWRVGRVPMRSVPSCWSRRRSSLRLRRLAPAARVLDRPSTCNRWVTTSPIWRVRRPLVSYGPVHYTLDLVHLYP